ncbi:MAG: 3-deoxy-D-manno-octulosonic acid transferase [Caulobacteraceae bacterium]|nr:3-deoxy-D-manno-octulosonic acid transferase [Caulobacteraceae bacterium]
MAKPDPEQSLVLTLYRWATTIFGLVVPALLRARARRGKEDPARLDERMGIASTPRPPGGLVWIHSVSVGESLSVLPLIERLARQRPDLTILSTSATVTAAALLARRLPPGVIHQYAPVDTPAISRRFLNHWRPDLMILVEGEIWPNLILGARARGARLALLSARITEKTAAGWARAPQAAAALLSCLDLVKPQDGASAERLAKFGVQTAGPLNLKLVGEVLPFDADVLADLKGQIGERPVVLAASTHAGEEAMIVQAFRKVTDRDGRDALLILAPRHPERLDPVLDAIGGPCAVRSRGDLITSQSDLYVADTLGELGLFYRLAQVAVLGGSLVPGIGGHNPLEPARLAVPVIAGPYGFNFAEIYQAMFADGQGALLAADVYSLAEQIARCLADPLLARAIGQAGLAFATGAAASLDQAMSGLEPLLP